MDERKPRLMGETAFTALWLCTLIAIGAFASLNWATGLAILAVALWYWVLQLHQESTSAWTACAERSRQLSALEEKVRRYQQQFGNLP